MHTTYRRRFLAILFMVFLSFSLVVCAVLKTAAAGMAAQSGGVSFSAHYAPRAQPPSRPPRPENRTSAAGEEASNAPLYIIRLVGNELRVYARGQGQAYTVVPSADPRTFRESDRLRLIDGIEIDSPQALAQLIEDFSS